MKALPRVFLRQRVNQPEYRQHVETCSIVREDDPSDLNIKQFCKKRKYSPNINSIRGQKFYIEKNFINVFE